MMRRPEPVPTTPTAMNRSLSIALAWFLAAGCAAPDGPGSVAATGFSPRPARSGHVEDTLMYSLVPGPVSLRIPTARIAARDEVVLDVWRDPAFREYFARSLVSETDIEPTVTLDERETMQRVLEDLGDDDTAGALELLEENLGPASSAVFDYTYGQLHFEEEKFEIAVPAYLSAIEKFPSFRRAWRFLGFSYARLGEVEQAIPALTKVLELGGGDAPTYGLLAYSYATVGNHLSAEFAYRNSLLLQPDSLESRMGLAISLFKQRRYPDAIALCDELLEENPTSATLWLLQANAFIGLEQPLRAAENFEMVDALGQSTAASLTGLAKIYMTQDLHGEAVDSVLRALEMGAEADIESAIAIARVLNFKGEVAATRRLVDAIDELHGQRLDKDELKGLLKMRARLAVAEGAGGEAVGILEESIALDPLDGEAILLLGEHYEREANVEQALFLFERAAGLEDFEASARLKQGQLLARQRRFAEALPHLRRAYQLTNRTDIRDFIETVEGARTAR